MTHRFIARAAVLATTLILTATTVPAGAASACKGLEKRQCESKSECTWVDGYARKDGVKVSAHCKSIGKRKKKDSSSSTE